MALEAKKPSTAETVPQDAGALFDHSSSLETTFKIHTAPSHRKLSTADAPEDRYTIDAIRPSTGIGYDQLIRGKSKGMWLIERRRAVRRLSAFWRQIVPHIGTPDFLREVNIFVEDIEREMPRYQGVPREDVFSDILQLIRDHLSGATFKFATEGRFNTTIDEAFLLAAEDDLTLSILDEIMKLFLAAVSGEGESGQEEQHIG